MQQIQTQPQMQQQAPTSSQIPAKFKYIIVAGCLEKMTQQEHVELQRNFEH